MVMSVLRRQRLLRNKRYSDGVVICSFADYITKNFAPIKERQTARDKLLQQRRDQQANKGGVQIPDLPTIDPPFTGPVMPMNQNVTVSFPLSLTTPFDDARCNKPIQLIDVRIVGGSHKHCFQITHPTKSNIPYDIATEKGGGKTTTAASVVQLSFRSKGTGVYRATLDMKFRDNATTEKEFSILRNILLRAGDTIMYDMLKPTTPFVKKKKQRQEKPMKDEDVLDPPKLPSQASISGGAGAAEGAGAFAGYKDLKSYKVPLDVRELVENREMEGALVPPTYDTPYKEFPKIYASFWQQLLWVSELQAYEDIKLFDMEDVILERSGRFFKLYVSGLAEGRPSVLRGDIVECYWKGKKYRGRVYAVEQLDVLLEFHVSFHRNFDVNVDRVDRIRFTFTRTAFRTSHKGAFLAPKTMGETMLMPQPIHMTRILKAAAGQQDPLMVHQRKPPAQFSWASQTLNEEQKTAVQEIVKGSLRPMPYIIFGPPGTGKTSTIVEAVYQLARLHTNTSKEDDQEQQTKIKILLVAPSNDAADILVEKLEPYFPPSEMIRLLAYTRTMDQVPKNVKPYVRENLDPNQLGSEILSCQITVSTVNLAARLWCLGAGIPKDHFDVVCVDEAGHATEPEVIGVVGNMTNFKGKTPGQLVLAGDPQQLGPIISSDLCKIFGLGVSYMERLVKTSPAYKLDDNNMYPPELVTLLVRNYRSHPAILKLPNEMFYQNKLIPCGDKLITHNLVKWEHLPSDKGFPVVFHAVDGPKIRLALKAHDLGEVKVGSVETFQGQERRCIIISTVRSENELLGHDLKYNLGFVANEKRFNVAVTRAKALLIVVGNPRVLATDKKNWLPLLQYCRDNKSWLGEEWNENENEPESEEAFLLVNDGADKEEGDGDDDWHVVADQESCGFINREE